ncbi:Hemoglobin-like protein HbN [Tritonibacter multivorans]|uniref:Hemoglobin-like protein HbN n=1 Tax=Tritonibacter multivorans TaxID=928856 RepID=A0A0P1GJQ8_9RHOB|nr:group 1 truncated hemoglobin [Tritonibacter multivorans]MDA7421566.1 group 1 truncated hemoglobin [Tritonibacter multivorans]CUH82160.1 Hemoglobin-like protein HbN [Tritonibacter multivorans]SFC95440.1 hemoglobin [Tritonibacter multivorans]
MSQTLYDKYGGFKTVSRIVMTFYDLVLDSDEVGGFFEDVDLPRLVDHQTKFISSLLGGPVSFNDDRLLAVHRTLDIGHADFDFISNLLCEALEAHGMSEADIKTTLAAVDSKRHVIVTTS